MATRIMKACPAVASGCGTPFHSACAASHTSYSVLKRGDGIWHPVAIAKTNRRKKDLEVLALTINCRISPIFSKHFNPKAKIAMTKIKVFIQLQSESAVIRSTATAVTCIYRRHRRRRRWHSSRRTGTAKPQRQRRNYMICIPTDFHS